MRQSKAVISHARFYVSILKSGDGDSLCGHQHETVQAAVNCGDNAYRVIHGKEDEYGDRDVTYKKVSS